MQGEPARLGVRLVASAIDWTLALVVPFVVAGALASPLWPVIVATTVVTYFSVSLRRGRTPGMRVLRLWAERARGGRPGVPRALGRALVSLVQGFVSIGLFALLFAGVEAVPEAAATLVVLGVLGLGANAALVLDGERRTLLDRVFGLRVRQPVEGPGARRR